ncbi:hypothetical protein ACOSP7_030871 [Xanthoceras sorbifolium]
MFVSRTREETDKLVDEEKSNRDVNKSIWAWFKGVMYIVVGVAILSVVLAEPQIYSVENFSNAVNIPSLFISFILVPLATNARAAATSDITASFRKKPRTTSLAFSSRFVPFLSSFEIVGFILNSDMLQSLKKICKSSCHAPGPRPWQSCK